MIAIHGNWKSFDEDYPMEFHRSIYINEWENYYKDFIMMTYLEQI